MKKNCSLIISLMFSCFLFSQNSKNVKGIVTDVSNLPIPGVTVLEKGMENGIMTDFEGRFSISVSDENAILVFSFLGFATQEVSIAGQTEVNVQLQEETSELDEIVVVGYGTQKKSDVTTSVASIKGESLENERTSNVSEALTGKLAGVQIRQTSGAPGSNMNIRIRGASSITAGNNPLYVIDGVPISNESSTLSSIVDSRNGFQEQPTNPLASLDMDDIESIEVLKDASSAAIYGSRGSNGVVLITTKKGRMGDLQVSYSGSAGISSVLKKIDLLDAYGFAKLHSEAKNTAYLENVNGANIDDDNDTRVSKGGKDFQIPDELEPYLQGKQGLTNTDWQNEIFRTAVTQNHTISIQGGTEKSRYFSSINYFSQEGIVIGSKLTRFAARFNFEGNLSDKVKYGVRINPSRLSYDLVSSNGPIWNEGVVASTLAQAPIFPVRNADGTYNTGLLDWTYRSRGLSSEFVANPVAIANEVKDNQYTNRLIGNSFLDYEIIKDLHYRLSLGSEINDTRRDFYRPQRLETLFWLRFGPDAVSTSSTTFNWLVGNTLNYQKSFDNHNINLLVGYSSQKEDIKVTKATGMGFANDLVTTINAANNRDSETRQEQWSLISYLFRAQYNYDSKYYLSVAIRRDGSSRFGANNKWGNFPSASVGWRISQEDFLKDNNIIDELKLRASYGVTGNFQISNYGAIALVNSSDYVTGNDNISSGLSQSTASNKTLSWERTQTINIGLNTAFLNNLLTLEADYYTSDTSDLLLNVNVPRISGYATQLKNIGKVNNQGFEIALGIRKNFGDFSCKSSVNFSKNENRVLALGPEEDPIYADSGRGQAFVTEVGKPIGSYFGYVVEGIYNTQSEVDKHLTADSGTSKPGDFKFKDLNGDGRITVDDREVIGSYQPDFTYGFTTSLGYKNFDFSFALQGVQGNQVLNTLRNYTAIPTGGMNTIAEVENRWRSAGNTGDGIIPRANFRTTGENTRISTYYLEDGSYLKVQNITLGYKFSKNLTEKAMLNSVRVYASVQNPFLFTKYSGYNPEVSSNPTNQLGQGEDFGTYPLSRTFTMGLNINF